MIHDSGEGYYCVVTAVSIEITTHKHCWAKVCDHEETSVLTRPRQQDDTSCFLMPCVCLLLPLFFFAPANFHKCNSVFFLEPVGFTFMPRTHPVLLSCWEKRCKKLTSNKPFIIQYRNLLNWLPHIPAVQYYPWPWLRCPQKWLNHFLIDQYLILTCCDQLPTHSGWPSTSSITSACLLKSTGLGVGYPLSYSACLVCWDKLVRLKPIQSSTELVHYFVQVVMILEEQRLYLVELLLKDHQLSRLQVQILQHYNFQYQYVSIQFQYSWLWSFWKNLQPNCWHPKANPFKMPLVDEMMLSFDPLCAISLSLKFQSWLKILNCFIAPPLNGCVLQVEYHKS